MKKISAILCSMVLVAAMCLLPAVKSFAAGESASRTLVTGKISAAWIKEHGNDASAGGMGGPGADKSMGAGNGDSGSDGNHPGKEVSSGQDGNTTDERSSSASKGKKTDYTDGNRENSPDKKVNSDIGPAKRDSADSSDGNGGSADNGEQGKLPQTGTLEPGLYRLAGGGLMAVALTMLLAVAAKGRHHGKGRRRKFRLLGNY